MVEGAVADRADRILRQLILRHGEQAVEHRAGGLRAHALRGDIALAERAGEGETSVLAGAHMRLRATPSHFIAPGIPLGARGQGRHHHNAKHAHSADGSST